MSRSMAHEAVAALALARLPGVGRRRLRRLLARAAEIRPDTAARFEAFVRAELASPGRPAPGASDCERAWREAAALARTCRRRGWHLWRFGAPDYPAVLRRLAHPPALLFVQGATRLPQVPRLAIVGTREPTAWGEATAAECGRAAARAGALVVSGLARGIDTAAQSAVVEAGGATWAMLPSGLEAIYPESNRGLAARIVATGGALVSEYWPDTRPRPAFFVARDRLQAALADAVLVIETGRTGGTQHTIRFARELGVPVWVAFPEDAEATAARDAARLPEAQQGTWDLVRHGATRVAADVLPARLATLARADGAS
jgi:DNA processing protein